MCACVCTHVFVCVISFWSIVFFAALLPFVNQVTSERPVMDCRAVNSDQMVLNNMQLVLVGATMPRSIEEILGEVVPVGCHSVFLVLFVCSVNPLLLAYVLFCFTS